MPPEVEKLALDILNEPATVKVDPVTSTVDSVRQRLYLVDKANKKRLLADLLRQPQVESALVFVRTRHGADRVVRELKKAGIDARAIHGDKSQAARQEALSQFKEGKVRVLVATDIAARGIDIHGLSHVFNYDLPNEPEAYIHRIGRTGGPGWGRRQLLLRGRDEAAGRHRKAHRQNHLPHPLSLSHGGAHPHPAPGPVARPKGGPGGAPPGSGPVSPPGGGPVPPSRDGPIPPPGDGPAAPSGDGPAAPSGDGPVPPPGGGPVPPPGGRQAASPGGAGRLVRTRRAGGQASPPLAPVSEPVGHGHTQEEAR